MPAIQPSTAPLFIVFNLGAGHGSADAVRQAITEACTGAGRMLHLLEVDDPARLGEIARQAVQRAQAAGGVVVAAGGDGTINTVAQAVLGSGCQFGVLPQGTFNYFSRTHGIPAEPAAALQVLLTETAQPVQVGLVNGQVFLVNASLGLYPKLLEDREAWKRQWGRSRLVAFGAGLVTMLRGHRSLRLQIDVQGSQHESAGPPQGRTPQGEARRFTNELSTPTLFIGNNALQMEQLGLPQARAIDAGALAIVALKPVGRLALLGLLLRGALGRLGDADSIINFGCQRLTVAPSHRWSARGIKVATDGEVRRLRAPLVFGVSAEPLMLIRPSAMAPERQAAAAAAAEPSAA